MDREEAKKIHLDKSEKEALRIEVKGLPKHLHAEIHRSPFGFKYRLTRDHDTYEQNPASATAADSLEELKKLLNWDPK